MTSFTDEPIYFLTNWIKVGLTFIWILNYYCYHLLRTKSTHRWHLRLLTVINLSIHAYWKRWDSNSRLSDRESSLLTELTLKFPVSIKVERKKCSIHHCDVIYGRPQSQKKKCFIALLNVAEGQNVSTNDLWFLSQFVYKKIWVFFSI